jgi:hypothetical protein
LCGIGVYCGGIFGWIEGFILGRETGGLVGGGLFGWIVGRKGVGDFGGLLNLGRKKRKCKLGKRKKR